MAEVGVAIGTYGDRAAWTPYVRRAIASLENQTTPPDDFMWVHAKTLQEARNGAAEQLKDNEFLIFLDADDELDEHYIQAMRAVLDEDLARAALAIMRPSTIGVYEDASTDDRPVMLPLTDLTRRNCIVIGAMCPTFLFEAVGGFDDYPILEDWALWRKMLSAGAVIVDVPEAIYRVHVLPGSRNSAPTHGDTYARILREVPL